MDDAMSLGGDATIGGEDVPASSGRRTLGRGDTVGRYLVLSVRGHGGMGVVYAAHDPELDRKIALKVVRSPTGGQLDAQDRKRLLREAKALAQLSHPNVVTLHDVGEFGGGIFIAMEYIEGRTLKRWRAEERPSWREVLEVFLAAGSGLSAAHRAGLVHRDFKPDNVMIDQGGTVRVLDFGLAAPETTVLTTQDAHLGTPAYMAAEQHGSRTPDARADQFSFCVALYETLYGRRPFAGETAEQVAAAILRGRVQLPPPGSGVPRWIGRVVVRGLGVNPETRWPDMDTLLAALERGKGRRRQSLLGLGISGFVGLALGTWLVVRDDPNDCNARIAEIDRAWNPERSQAVHAAITEAGGSDRAAGHIDEMLGAYADSLRNSAKLGCQDERNQHISRAAAAMRWSCHEQHLARFSGAIDMLSAVEGASSDEAFRTVASLPPLSRCEEAEQLPQFREALADPRVARLQLRLLELELLWKFGRDNSLTADAEDAFTAAKGLGSDTAVAQASVTLSKILSTSGEVKRAGEVLDEGIDAAARAGSDDLEAATWHERSFVYLQAGRPYAALTAAKAAMAAFSRSGGASLNIGQIQNSMGAAYLVAGDLEAAQKSLEAASETLAGNPLDDASARFNLSVISSLRGNYRQAELEMRETIERTVELRGERTQRVAVRRTNLADILAHQGKYEEAEQLYVESIRTLMATSGEDYDELARARLHLAELRLDFGDVEEARKLVGTARHSLQETVGAEHPYTLEADVVQARVALTQGKVEEARGLLEPAHERFAALLGAEHPSIAPLAILLAQVWHASGESARALRLLEAQGDKLGQAHPEHPYLAVLLGRRAELELELGRVGEAAMAYGEAARRAAKGQLHPVDDAHLDYVGALLELRKGGDLGVARRRAERAKAAFVRHPGHGSARLRGARALLEEIEAGRNSL